MTPTPRVSVICAAWNGERFIGQTLDALKAQDEPNFEVIVVDDASTDSTPQLLASIGDPRFRIIRNATNLKVVESRNVAVDLPGDFSARSYLRAATVLVDMACCRWSSMGVMYCRLE